MASYFTANGISNLFKPENPLRFGLVLVLTAQGIVLNFQLYSFLRESALLCSEVWSLNSFGCPLRFGLVLKGESINPKKLDVKTWPQDAETIAWCQFCRLCHINIDSTSLVALLHAC